MLPSEIQIGRLIVSSADMFSCCDCVEGVYIPTCSSAQHAMREPRSFSNAIMDNEIKIRCSANQEIVSPWYLDQDNISTYGICNPSKVNLAISELTPWSRISFRTTILVSIYLEITRHPMRACSVPHVALS